MLDFGEALKEKLQELMRPKGYYLGMEKYYPFPITGCTDLEINQIMEKQNVKWLPFVYKSYLSAVGYWPGDMYIGYDIAYGYMMRYSFLNALNKSLKFEEQEIINESVFVFMNRQSAHHWFFKLDEGDDPPVYEYAENIREINSRFENGFIKTVDSLSLVLTEFIAERESEDERRMFLQNTLGK